MSFVDKENNTSTYPYCVTPTGIVLPDSWKSDAHTFVLPDGKYSMVASDVAAGKMVSLDPYLTPDYVSRNRYIYQDERCSAERDRKVKWLTRSPIPQMPIG